MVNTASGIEHIGNSQDEVVEYIAVDMAWYRAITVNYNDDGSLKDPRQKELEEYYVKCFETDTKVDVEKVKEIIERTLS